MHLCGKPPMATPPELLIGQKSDTVLEVAATAFESLPERSDFAGSMTDPDDGAENLTLSTHLPHTAFSDVSAAPRLTRTVSDRGMPRYSRTTLQ